MIKSIHRKIMPTDFGFGIKNENLDGLCDLLRGVPIVINAPQDLADLTLFGESEIIGMIDVLDTIEIEDDMVVGDIYFTEKYLDYGFKNFLADGTVDEIGTYNITKVSCLVFEKKGE